MAFSVKHLLRALHVPTTAERELRYLSESVSLVDLEMRQRHIDRGLFRG